MKSMRKKILLKNAWAMVLLMIMGVAVSACSGDDEPAVLEGVKADGSSFQLNEAGEATVEFTVSPANASVDNVALVNGTETFEAVKTTSTGNGKWEVNLKAKDLANVQANNNVTIQVAQNGGFSKEISINIADPFSIAGKFEVKNPREFNYYGVDPDHKFETCLPFVVTAKDGADLSMLDPNGTKVVDGSITSVVSADNFVVTPMKGVEFGYALRVNPEKLAAVQAAIPRFNTIAYNILLTSKNGRRDVLVLAAAACAPQGQPVENEQLTATSAELATSGFEKTVTIDVTTDLRHIGVCSLNGEYDVTVEEIGLKNDKGELVEEASFTPVYKTDEKGEMICDFVISGSDQYQIAPGNYTWVQRFHVSTTLGGVTYQITCADLPFKFTVK